jgi:hypothetical protein
MGSDSVITRRRRRRVLGTAGAVIDALGGTFAVARLTAKTPQEISNARRRGRLPPSTILVLREVLVARNIYAPASLWGAIEPRSGRLGKLRV